MVSTSLLGSMPPAFVGFMGVNIAALRHFGFNPVPLIGFLVCAFLWWNLTPPARNAGLLWLAIGTAYGYYSTNGFSKPLGALETTVE